MLITPELFDYYVVGGSSLQGAPLRNTNRRFLSLLVYVWPLDPWVSGLFLVTSSV